MDALAISRGTVAVQRLRDLVQTYNDSKGENAIKGNTMGCQGGNSHYYRTVQVLDVMEPGGMVKIKGTGNMHKIEGCIHAEDARENLIFDKDKTSEGGLFAKRQTCQ
jgi:hypothetical protein